MTAVGVLLAFRLIYVPRKIFCYMRRKIKFSEMIRFHLPRGRIISIISNLPPQKINRFLTTAEPVLPLLNVIFNLLVRFCMTFKFKFCNGCKYLTSRNVSNTQFCIAFALQRCKPGLRLLKFLGDKIDAIVGHLSQVRLFLLWKNYGFIDYYFNFFIYIRITNGKFYKCTYYLKFLCFLCRLVINCV